MGPVWDPPMGPMKTGPPKGMNGGEGGVRGGDDGVEGVFEGVSMSHHTRAHTRARGWGRVRPPARYLQGIGVPASSKLLILLRSGAASKTTAHCFGKRTKPMT